MRFALAGVEESTNIAAENNQAKAICRIPAILVRSGCSSPTGLSIAQGT